MEMVSILLYFTKAQRDGLWELHLYAFRHTLPFVSVHSKKTTWLVFQHHHRNLSHLGNGHITEDIIKSAEKFICQLYGVPEAYTCDVALVKLFCIGQAQEALPPTSDATRSHYQTSV